MRIKTQLILSVVILGVIFVIISASVISTNQQIDRMNRQEDLANNIVRGSYELSHLSNDYLLNQENRQLTQWRSKFSSFSDNLAQLNPSTPEQQTLVDNIRTNQRRLQDVFNQVVSTIESPNDTQSKSADSEFIQVSWSRIGVQNQGIIFDASRLSQTFHNESDKLQQNNTLLTYASLVILLLVLLFNFVFTSRRILRSLSNLQDGTKIIGSGNLDYAIDESSKDEIGELSHAFNRMASNLKGVTASKVDLEKEIDERKRAEEALRETTGYLQNLFDYANAPIITWDTGFHITRFNHAFELLTDRRQEEVLGKTLDILFPDESRRASMALIQKTLEGERWETVEIPILTTDGSVKTVLWNSANVLDSQGNLTATIAQGFDITERKRAEQSAKESLELYQTLSESAKDIIFICDPAGNLHYFNKNGAAVFGVSVDDLTGKTFEQAFPPDIAKEQRRQLDLVLASKKPLFAEINILLPKINLWLDVQLIPIFTEQGTIKSVMGVARDITPRKNFEQKLQVSEERFRVLFEEALDGICLADAKTGIIIDCNQALVTLVGRERGELIGQPQSILHPSHNDNAAYSPTFRQHLADKKGQILETQVVTKTGILKEVDIKANILNIRGRELVQGIFRDITERKRAEEQLIEFNERFKNVARATNDIVWDWELKTNNLWWSDSIYTVFGYKPEDIEPTIESWYTRLHPEDRDRVVTSIHAVIDGGGLSWSGEYRFRKADSSYAYVFDRGFVIRDNHGKAVRMIGAMLDITERKRAEEALKNYSGRLEEMVNERTRQLMEAQDQLVKKEKLAVLGKLAGGVGHELRNPLGAIKNAAYFLDMALEKPDPDVKEMVELINKEVVRSEDIISSLLDFARPKVLTLRKGSVNTVVNEALKRNPVPKNIAVINNPDETLPEIQADSDKLLQVFNNIISNAFQAMTEGGSLTITSKKSGPGGVSIAFADTGLGISAENMKKLFEPLFTTKIKGIGLGMVVTKTIVEAHGGHIDVQSEEGKGTTITVNLPMSGRKED